MTKQAKRKAIRKDGALPKAKKKLHKWKMIREDQASSKAKKSKQLTIGEFIKLARKKQNKRADDVAILCNVTRACVFQWERRAYIIEKRLPELSIALGIPIVRLKAVNANGKRSSN
ncbi:hypothetical protein I6F35_02560 [Bradyrhizobium sp. BRP22]|uniref:hypothetical protein n=1 Tax=Bradyrhizobium sp. BRP22 TaxID=2793821 RepID=UPI001CD7A8E1|nr:hypothetical protein [Bradyrhizobium sp. BRP22]MCA1452095.1 hypothetical protein [Bradyrhizobium sp. BRP22]